MDNKILMRSNEDTSIPYINVQQHILCHIPVILAVFKNTVVYVLKDTL